MKLLGALTLLSGMLLAVVGTNVYAQTSSPSPTPTTSPTATPRAVDTTPKGAPQTGFGTLSR